MGTNALRSPEANEVIAALSVYVDAGKEFDFKYTLKNTHTSKAAKNIKITVEQADGVFIPVAGSNIFYIESIEGDISNYEASIADVYICNSTLNEYCTSWKSMKVLFHLIV